MRTAEAMYNWCLEQGYGKGFSRSTAIKHFQLITDTLAPEEEAHIAFIGLHNFISMTKNDQNFAYAITNKRIIMAQHRLFGSAIQTVAIDQINDITSVTGIAFCVITVDTIKETFNVAVNKVDGKRLASRMHDYLLEVKDSQQHGGTPVLSSADEILKFKDLLEKGVISPEEYKAKKKQLLNI